MLTSHPLPGLVRLEQHRRRCPRLLGPGHGDPVRRIRRFFYNFPSKLSLIDRMHRHGVVSAVRILAEPREVFHADIPYFCTSFSRLLHGTVHEAIHWWRCCGNRGGMNHDGRLVFIHKESELVRLNDPVQSQRQPSRASRLTYSVKHASLFKVKEISRCCQKCHLLSETLWMPGHLPSVVNPTRCQEGLRP